MTSDSPRSDGGIESVSGDHWFPENPVTVTW